jgi:hypothetical protein
MIVSRNIPLTLHTFFRNVQIDYDRGMYSGDYRGFLERETRKRYPGLVEGLSEAVGSRKGTRVIADADHIVPRSLWATLIPLAWNLAGPPPASPDVLSNLFWRTVTYNRGSEKRGEALDQPDIRRIQFESKTKASAEWARFHILAFLRHKHDEGVNVDMPVEPHRIDQMTAGGDLAGVVEFIRRLRQQQPGISTHAIAEAVEKKFPHIQIDIDGRGPRIAIG